MKKIFRFRILSVLAAAAVTPFVVAAQQINITQVKTYTDSIIGLINRVIVPALFAVAFLYFIYGVYKYFILGADSDTEVATGRKFVLWGIIGFVVILSFWGLVNVGVGLFNLGGQNAPTPPTFGAQGSASTGSSSGYPCTTSADCASGSCSGSSPIGGGVCR